MAPATTVPTREAILAQLEDVYDQQRHLREEEIRLKGLLNAMLPVNQIPAEILTRIFTLRPESPATRRGRIGRILGRESLRGGDIESVGGHDVEVGPRRDRSP